MSVNNTSNTSSGEHSAAASDSGNSSTSIQESKPVDVPVNEQDYSTYDEYSVEELEAELARRRKLAPVQKKTTEIVRVQKERKPIVPPRPLSEIKMQIRPVILPENQVRCHVCKDLHPATSITNGRIGRPSYVLICPNCSSRSTRRIPVSYLTEQQRGQRKAQPQRQLSTRLVYDEVPQRTSRVVVRRVIEEEEPQPR